jgi:hypothetical protein
MTFDEWFNDPVHIAGENVPRWQTMNGDGLYYRDDWEKIWQAATAAERERWVSVVRYAASILYGLLDRALSDAEAGEG